LDVEASDAPHATKSSHASLTEVSPTSWCTNTVAFPRRGKRQASTPTHQVIETRSRVGAVGCYPYHGLWTAGASCRVSCQRLPSFLLPFCLRTGRPGCFRDLQSFKIRRTFWDVPIIPAVRAPTGARTCHVWSCRDCLMQWARRARRVSGLSSSASSRKSSSSGDRPRPSRCRGSRHCRRLLSCLYFWGCIQITVMENP
jgi:hypothetical protein